MVAIKESGSVIIIVSVAVQVWLSIMFTIYSPAIRFDANESVCAGTVVHV